MNKIISINISGIVFSIEENAFAALTRYMESLRAHLQQSVDGREILQDIEARIAELLSEAVTSEKQAIVLADIDRVISTLGQPEEYGLEEEEPTVMQATGKGGKKQIYRDTDNMVLAGVLSGLSHYFHVDPLWMRLGFALVLFLGWGSPIIVYILLWIIIPKAETTAEKLQMHGEPVTFESIKRKVEEESTLKKGLGSEPGQKIRSAFQEMLHAIFGVIRSLARVIAKILGLMLVLFGIVASMGLLGVFLFGTAEGSELEWGNEHHVFGLFPSTSDDALLIQYGAFFAGLSFLIMMVLLGLQLIVRQWAPFRKYRLGAFLTGSFVVSLVCLGVGALHTGLDYRQQEMHTITHPIELEQDTLRLSVDKHPEMFSELNMRRQHARFDGIMLKGDKVYVNDVRLGIVGVDSTKQAELKLEIYANGETDKLALQRARNIQYHYRQDSTGTIYFDPFLEFDLRDRYRAQEIDITLYLPIGRAVYLDPTVVDLIFDIKNTTNTYDRDMVGHTWVMTDKGLYCPDFTKEVD